MSVRTYTNTIRDFTTWADAMNRILGSNEAPYDYARNGGANGAAGTTESKSVAVTLPLDIWTTDSDVHIAAYLPGVNPEDVEITLEGDELMIRGNLPSANDDGQFIKRELFHGAFERRMSFNVPVDGDKIEASFTNGLLTLTVPKAEEVRPKYIKVQSK